MVLEVVPRTVFRGFRGRWGSTNVFWRGGSGAPPLPVINSRNKFKSKLAYLMQQSFEIWIIDFLEGYLVFEKINGCTF